MSQIKKIATILTILAFTMTLPGCTGFTGSSNRTGPSTSSFHSNTKSIRYNKSSAHYYQPPEDISSNTELLAGIGAGTAIGFLGVYLLSILTVCVAMIAV